MPRGGYQKPSKPAAVSGPGKFSRRTDGQAVNPDIDHPDLQYGDRSMLEEANKAAPVRGAAGARVPRMTGEVPTRGSLPPWFSGTADTAPGEPTSAGLPMGPGPGPEALMASEPAEDAREIVLQFLADTYGNQDAIAMLSELRAGKAARQQPQIPNAPLLGPGLPPASSDAPNATPAA